MAVSMSHRPLSSASHSLIPESLSVILPAYNEGRYIAQSIVEAHHALSEFCSGFEVVVVNDGSSDDTQQQAEFAARRFSNVLVCANPTNLGKGFALREGFDSCKGDLVVFLDADLDIHPRQIRPLIQIMQQTNADIVIGSKRHPQSVLDYPLHRRVLSVGYFFLVKLLFGLPIRDTQTGLKLFRAQVLREVMPTLVVKRFAFDLELLANAHRKGYCIAEAPVVVRQLRVKLNPVGLWQAKDIWLDTMGILYRMRILQYYDRYPNVAPEETRGFQFWESVWIAVRYLYRRMWVQGEGIPWWILWRR
ncbi:MAG: hypothetical protein AUJ92_05595 [Armatimonadetes bacterium CG2_30_59_28]|nr:MAG: hypothetical protein AUJ92_05595 [Armatimonadetes bacterium CG2_30_59_28]